MVKHLMPTEKMEARLIAGFSGVSSTKGMRLMAQIEKWWGMRILAGTQLSVSEGLTPGYHYRGEGPWFDEVEMGTLKNDFRLMFPYTADSSSMAFFRSAFIDATGCRIKDRYVNIRDRFGNLYLRPRLSFARFKGLQEYVETGDE